MVTNYFRDNRRLLDVEHIDVVFARFNKSEYSALLVSQVIEIIDERGQCLNFRDRDRRTREGLFGGR